MSDLPQLSETHTELIAVPPGVAFMDDQYLPMSEAKISVLDFGFLHSDATYDVVHVWKGAFFRLEDHLDRFLRGVGELHLSLPYARDEIAEILHNCVALSGLRNAYVELICTRGTSPSFSRDPRDSVNRFIAFAIPFASIADAVQLEHGLHAAITDVVRIPPSSVDPTVKNYHWLDFVAGLYRAYELGAETAILVDSNGQICEGPGFNIFMVRDGAIATPASGTLLGVTRQTVFELCAEMDLACSAQEITVLEVESADEVFITSTAGGVMPVTKIDNQIVGSGAVGAVTRRITEEYWRMHEREPFSSRVDYPD